MLATSITKIAEGKVLLRGRDLVADVRNGASFPSLPTGSGNPTTPPPGSSCLANAAANLNLMRHWTCSRLTACVLPWPWHRAPILFVPTSIPPWSAEPGHGLSSR